MWALRIKNLSKREGQPRVARRRGAVPLSRAARPVLEALEGRTLFAVAPTVFPASVHAVPLVATAAVNQPKVTATRPANGAIDVARDTLIAADLYLPNGGIDANTITVTTVRLYKTSDHSMVAASSVNTSGGGDAIVYQPKSNLDAFTSYTFEVSDNVKDITGVALIPYKITFTTGAGPVPAPSPISFNKVALTTSQGHAYTSVEKGPDGKLYATTIDGQILRFAINSDGTLGTPQVITTIQDHNGGNEYVTGMSFDPHSTASNLIVWVSHGPYAEINAPDFSGKISRLTGANLENYQDAVISLPRSVRDHLNNQPVFGPDGALYWGQASSSAMGAPDAVWGNRVEHLLTAAILRLDTNVLSAQLDAGKGPLNVLTKDAGGSYDPYAASAPLTIYATGIRNAFDLVWHSNGELYAPTNGSAAGGNTPKDPTQSNTALTNVGQTEDDWLFRISYNRYYGHPNPLRKEYILDGGNPTDGDDPEQFAAYPVGTLPDPNWRKAVYDFGANYSPDGAIEYAGNAAGGVLNGAILVVQYSGGDNIIALKPDATGRVVSEMSPIPGFSGFVDPIDLTEDKSNGYVYVAEYGGKRLTLLKPQNGASVPDKAITPSSNRVVFNDVIGDSSGQTRDVVLRNSGAKSLSLSASQIVFLGTNAASFSLASAASLPATLAPGDSVTVTIQFTAAAGAAAGVQTATLRVFDAPGGTPLNDVSLRGLATVAAHGAGEPSLQKILDLYEIPITVGDDDPSTPALPDVLAAGNQEQNVQRLIKISSASSVTIEPLAVFAPDADPAARLGWYDYSNPVPTELFTVPQSENATVGVDVEGVTSFDPGSTAFGLFLTSPAVGGNTVYSEDGRNTWETNPASTRKVRFYPLKNKDGSSVANAYVVAFSEQVGTGGDYQDVVAIVRNVRTGIDPAAPEPGATAVTGLSLVDASTGATTGTLANNGTIKVDAGKSISLVANTSGAVGSVKFVLDGQAVRVENSTPYTIAGKSGATILPWTPTVGTHTLTVTTYSGKDASANAAGGLSITFTVTGAGAGVPPITGVRVLNANSGNSLLDLTDGATVNLAALSTRQLNIAAVLGGSGSAGSIRFDYDETVGYQVDNGSPFTLAGDNPGPTYNAITPTVGAHTLTVTPFSGPDATGNQGTPMTIHFNVIDQSVGTLPPGSYPMGKFGINLGFLPWYLRRP